jgi:hypothetical protein
MFIYVHTHTHTHTLARQILGRYQADTLDNSDRYSGKSVPYSI